MVTATIKQEDAMAQVPFVAAFGRKATTVLVAVFASITLGWSSAGAVPVCQTVNGIPWCYNNSVCGQPCNSVCATAGGSPINDDIAFEAQNTEAECLAIAQAFGIGSVDVGNYSYACIEDSPAPHPVGGGLVAPLRCSTNRPCPFFHRAAMDYLIAPCFEDSLRSVCPCGLVTTCGDRNLEPGEDCDDGNTADGDCCDSSCHFEPASTECRPSAGVCDVTEHCTGTSADCPPDDKSTAVCRPATDICDAVESCDGSGVTCPADGFESSTVICRASAGICDVGESCTGAAPNCPPDSFIPSSTVCRPATDVCDMTESCTGSGPACPTDAVEPADDGLSAGRRRLRRRRDLRRHATSPARATPSSRTAPSCDDGDFCPQTDACDGNGTCVGIEPDRLR